MSIKLTNTKFYLTPISLNHLDDLFILFQDKELCHFYGIKQHSSRNQTAAKIQLNIKQLENKSGFHFSIINNETNEAIGQIGLNNLKQNESGEIGFGLRSDFKGQGIMSDAVNKVLDYAFSKYQLNRIEAQTDPNNLGCIRVLEQNNFKKEDHLKKDFFAHGKFYDTLIFGILKTNDVLTKKQL